MRRLFNYFLRGLVFVVPIAITVYVCWKIFITIDGWLGFDTPGAGFVATVAVITIVGVLASHVLTRGAQGLVDALMSRLPVVRFLYSAIKDIMTAFVGERRRFDKPVLLTLVPGTHLRALGFVTRQSLDALGLPGQVAVYVPQSYNVAGNLLVVPASQVQPLAAESGDVMAFIVSGGVTGLASRADSAAAAVPARS